MTLTAEEKALREMLDREASRINRPEFVEADPVQFARLYTDKRDAEIASLLCATIAWGRRDMICRDCSRLMLLMDHQPHRFVLEDGAADIDPDMNIHRTFFGRDLRLWLRALKRVYTAAPTLDDYARSHHVGLDEQPAWRLAALLNAELAEAAREGGRPCRCLPQNLADTALKRLNMALRWLVRDDGRGVDLGLWSSLTPAQLYVPLDVHVGRLARQLGLLTRRTDDRRAVLELTARLRRLRPADPVWYDFALFGLGVEGGANVNLS